MARDSLDKGALFGRVAAKSERGGQLVGKSLEFGTRITVDLSETVVPVLVDARLAALPHDVKLAVCHSVQLSDNSMRISVCRTSARRATSVLTALPMKVSVASWSPGVSGRMAPVPSQLLM